MERNNIIIKTSILGIVVNVLLVLFKGIVGFLTSSIAIILDAVNNLTDASASCITIIGTKLSLKSPTKKHPYGYGRIEYFTSVIIALFVLAAGATALIESIKKIINPSDATYSHISLIIILVFVLVKFFFGKYVKNVGKKVNSNNLIASGSDAFMDAILSFTTFISALLNYIWKLNLEGYLGIIIAIFIIKTSLEILKDTIDSLLGVRADSLLTKKIKKEVMQFSEVQGVYDLNLHNYGPSNIIASLHIQVKDEMMARDIHILTREISYLIYEKFGIILTIGIYAANDKGEFGDIKKELAKIIKKYKTIIQLHGFYVDNRKENVFFDLIFDFSEKDKEKIKDQIVNELKEKYPKYNFNVIIDYDITDSYD